MDCDVYGPSVPLLIGAAGQPQSVAENLISPIESYGVKVMSMGFMVDEETPIVWRGADGHENNPTVFGKRRLGRSSIFS